ncbi:iron transporter, partial [Streptomyces sp. NPDC001130]
MNATPTPDGSSGAPDEQGDSGTPGAPVPLAESVPPQKRRTADLTRVTEPGAELLEDPDPRTAAQAAAVENLLRCWVRETSLAAPVNGTLHVPLPASGAALLVPVRYWSPTGWHRFGPPRLVSAPEAAPDVDA